MTETGLAEWAEADLAFSIICICDNDAVARDAGC